MLDKVLVCIVYYVRKEKEELFKDIGLSVPEELWFCDVGVSGIGRFVCSYVDELGIYYSTPSTDAAGER